MAVRCFVGIFFPKRAPVSVLSIRYVVILTFLLTRNRRSFLSRLRRRRRAGGNTRRRSDFDWDSIFVRSLYLRPGEIVVEVVLHLIVLWQAQQVAVLHIDEIVWLREKKRREPSKRDLREI